MPAKTIAIIQPVYLPWLGYFEQIARTDRFVVYDDVQYTRQDWRNRNRIPGANGPIWLTVPVRRAPLGTPIREIEIDNRHRWVAKHLGSIEQTYRAAPHFEPCHGVLEDILRRGWTRLADLDLALIRALCAGFGIAPGVVLSSDIPSDPGFVGRFDRAAEDPAVARRNMRLVEICRQQGAGLFYVGARARDYIDTALFARFGIEVVFQDYRHPVYPQRRPGFQPHMAAIDLLMNTGPDARGILLSSPAPDFAIG